MHRTCLSKFQKIKDYKEAYNLLQSNLGSMSAEEKAKCYNKLVDISYEKVIKEQGTETENQMAKQFGKETVPYDTVGLYDAVLKAIEDGVTCDEFDNQPNEKGKVKPKFHKSNSDRLYGIRGQAHQCWHLLPEQRRSTVLQISGNLCRKCRLPSV